MPRIEGIREGFDQGRDRALRERIAGCPFGELQNGAIGGLATAITAQLPFASNLRLNGKGVGLSLTRGAGLPLSDTKSFLLLSWTLLRRTEADNGSGTAAFPGGPVVRAIVATLPNRQ